MKIVLRVTYYLINCRFAWRYGVKVSTAHEARGTRMLGEKIRTWSSLDLQASNQQPASSLDLTQKQTALSPTTTTAVQPKIYRIHWWPRIILPPRRDSCNGFGRIRYWIRILWMMLSLDWFWKKGWLRIEEPQEKCFNYARNRGKWTLGITRRNWKGLGWAWNGRSWKAEIWNRGEVVWFFGESEVDLFFFRGRIRNGSGKSLSQNLQKEGCCRLLLVLRQLSWKLHWMHWHSHQQHLPPPHSTSSSSSSSCSIKSSSLARQNCHRRLLLN